MISPCTLIYAARGGNLKIYTLYSGAIPCQWSEKKGQRWKVDFFYEMWKIKGQIDDLDRFLNNSCNLGVLLAKNQKYQKNDWFEKVKIEKKKKKY